MKTKPYYLLLLLLLLMSVTNCSADSDLDEVERNIEKLKEQLPYSQRNDLLMILADIELDKKQRTVRYIMINERQEDIINGGELDKTRAERFYFLYLGSMIDPHFAEKVDAGLTINFRFLNSECTQEINITISPKIYSILSSATAEEDYENGKISEKEIENMVELEYEEGKVSPGSLVLQHNMMSLLHARFMKYVKYMSNESVELTNEQQGEIYGMYSYTKEFTNPESFSAAQLAISEQVVKKVKAIPRKELDYPILKVVDDKHFIYHVVVSDEYSKEMNKYTTSDKKLTDEGMVNVRENMKPYSGQLENIEVEYYDSKGNLLVSDRVK